MKRLLILFFFLFCGVAHAEEYYIGQWEWNETNPDEPYWQAPQSQYLTGSIDLRSLPDQAEKGGNPKGYGLFAYSQLVSDQKLTHMGSNLDEAPNVKARGAIQSKLGINPVSATIREIIYELLTQEADPTGNSKWKPLRPNKENKMQIYFGTEGIIKEVALIPSVSPEWPMVVRAMQEDYRQMVRTEKHTTVAKALDFWEEQFGVPYQTFIPKDEIQIASLPHETTISDDFTNTDGTDIASHSAGGFSWIEDSGTLEISGNRVQEVGNNAFARAYANTDLSSDDHYAQITSYEASGIDDEVRAYSRFNASPLNGYYFTRDGADSGGILERSVFKIVSGTLTKLTDEAAAAPADGTLLRIEVEGSNVKFYESGVLELSTTDSAVTGHLKTAIACRITGELDDFEAADIAIGGVTDLRLIFPSGSGTVTFPSGSGSFIAQ